jgi:large subunit ribosomal protein L15
MQLNNLEKVVEPRKRVGRGGARGGQSGRGSKGQKARSGGTVRPLFEGGQMPLFRRLPKRGFSNERFAVVSVIVNLRDLERCFLAGDTVNFETLCEKGLLKKSQHRSRLKILGNGDLKKALKVYAHACSTSAAEAIKKHKGEVNIIVEER